MMYASGQEVRKNKWGEGRSDRRTAGIKHGCGYVGRIEGREYIGAWYG